MWREILSLATFSIITIIHKIYKIKQNYFTTIL